MLTSCPVLIGYDKRMSVLPCVLNVTLYLKSATVTSPSLQVYVENLYKMSDIFVPPTTNVALCISISDLEENHSDTCFMLYQGKRPLNPQITGLTGMKK